MADEQAIKSKVFISYSRKDKEFVARLKNALDTTGINAWVDWEGIPLSADWMAEITAAIEAADSFLFVISPDSLASEICRNELQVGLQYNKKLVPILYRDPEKGSTMHEKLSSTNWVYLRPQDDFEATLPKLVDSIVTDLDWVRQHTRLLQRALEWDSKNRSGSFMLQGEDLEEAEKWRSAAAVGANRTVVPLQNEYIDASQKRAKLNQRIAIGLIVLALMVSIIFSVVAWQLRGEAVVNANAAATARVEAELNADEAKKNAELANQKSIEAEQNADEARKNAEEARLNEQKAKAQRSAARAQYLQQQTSALYESTLLAVAAWLEQARVENVESAQTEEILRQNISALGIPFSKMRQNDQITNIVFHPTEERFVTTSEDKSACAWEADGTKIKCVSHTSTVSDALFVRNGTILITAGQDGVVQFWQWPSLNEERPAFKVSPLSPIYDMAIDPDERWLALAREDGIVTIYNIENNKKFQDIALPGFPVIFAVEFSPDGDSLGIAPSSGQITLWSINGVINGPRHVGAAYALDFSSDSRRVVSGGSDSAARLGAPFQGGQRIVTTHADWVEDVDFGPDPSWFVTASDDDQVRVWNAVNGEEKLRMPHDNFVIKVLVSPDGQWIASTGYDQTVRVWNAASGNRMFAMPIEGRGFALEFSSDGHYLVAGDSNGFITVWDMTILSLRTGYIQSTELVRQATFSSNGEWLIANSDDRRIWLLKQNQWAQERQAANATTLLSLSALSEDFVVSPDSRWLAVRPQSSDQAILYDLKTNKEASRITHAETITSLVFGPASDKLIVGGSKGQVAVWLIGEKVELSRSFMAGERIGNLVFEPEKNTLLVGTTNNEGSTGHLYGWNLETGSRIGEKELPGGARTMAISPDGRWVFVATSNGYMLVWDSQTNSDTPLFTYANKQALSAQFSPDSSMLAIGSGEGFTYIYELAGGTEINRISHAGRVTSVSFSPDGKTLATVAGKVVQLWQVNDFPRISLESLTEIACLRLSNAEYIDWNALFGADDYSNICPKISLGR